MTIHPSAAVGFASAADVYERARSSYPQDATVDREELLVRVRALTHGLVEPFAFPYKTEVLLIPRLSDRDESERGTSIKG